LDVGWTLKHHQLPLVEFRAKGVAELNVGWTLKHHQLPLVEFRAKGAAELCRLDFKAPPTAVGGIPCKASCRIV